MKTASAADVVVGVVPGLPEERPAVAEAKAVATSIASADGGEVTESMKGSTSSSLLQIQGEKKALMSFPSSPLASWRNNPEPRSSSTGASSNFLLDRPGWTFLPRSATGLLQHPIRIVAVVLPSAADDWCCWDCPRIPPRENGCPLHGYSEPLAMTAWRTPLSWPASVLLLLPSHGVVDPSSSVEDYHRCLYC